MDSKPHSKEFAEAKQALLENVRVTFGWERLHRMEPAVLKQLEEDFTRPYTASFEQHLPGPPSASQSQRANRGIFGETRDDGSRNDDRLTTHDPEVMDVVNAIVHQYAQCNAWDGESVWLKRQQMADNDDPAYVARNKAVEDVRLQIAPYYIDRLMEQGHSVDDALKIVGQAIYRYTETVAKNDTLWSQVYPLRDREKTPSAMVEEIRECGRAVHPQKESEIG